MFFQMSLLKIVPIFAVAEFAAFNSEIILAATARKNVIRS
jgi:hypothetical protein